MKMFPGLHVLRIEICVVCLFYQGIHRKKGLVEVKLREERAKVKTDERMDQTRTEQHLWINQSSLKEQN